MILVTIFLVFPLNYLQMIQINFLIFNESNDVLKLDSENKIKLLKFLVTHMLFSYALVYIRLVIAFMDQEILKPSMLIVLHT